MTALAFLLALSDDAFARSPACRWQGEHLTVAYWGEVRLQLGRADGGSVPLEMSIRAAGAVADPLTSPVEIHLSDGSTVRVTPTAPAAGRVAVSPTGLTTFYDVRAALDTTTLRAIADGGGVSHFHFDLPAGAWEVPVPNRQRDDLADAAICLLRAIPAR